MPMTTAQYQRCMRRVGWPVAATLERVAELLGQDLAAVEAAAGGLEPYEHADGTLRWSLRAIAFALGLERRPSRTGTGAKRKVGA